MREHKSSPKGAIKSYCRKTFLNLSLLSDFKTKKINTEERTRTAGREILRADLPVYEVKVRRQAVDLKVLE